MIIHLSFHVCKIPLWPNCYNMECKELILIKIESETLKLLFRLASNWSGNESTVGFPYNSTLQTNYFQVKDVEVVGVKSISHIHRGWLFKHYTNICAVRLLIAPQHDVNSMPSHFAKCPRNMVLVNYCAVWSVMCWNVVMNHYDIFVFAIISRHLDDTGCCNSSLVEGEGLYVYTLATASCLWLGETVLHTNLD